MSHPKNSVHVYEMAPTFKKHIIVSYLLRSPQCAKKMNHKVTENTKHLAFCVLCDFVVP